MAEARQNLPAHLVSLPGGQWALWRWTNLSGAGFPIDGVLQLAAPEAAAAADELLRLETAVTEAQQAALQAINTALDRLRAEKMWHDTERRQPLVRALKAAKKGVIPSHPPQEIEPAIMAWQAAMTQLTDAQTRLSAAYETAVRHCSITIYDLLHKGRFQEALIWQNRPALHRDLLPILQDPRQTELVRNWRRRQAEELVASYLQRYSAKSTQVGFFGPVGWARIVDQAKTVTIQPGESLVKTCQVYFERWCIEALVQAITAHHDLHPWLPPRRLPLAVLTEAKASWTAVLAACDGQQSARQLAKRLMEQGIEGLESEAAVFAVLRELEKQQLIVWSLELPVQVRPERRVWRLLEQIEDDAVRQAALAPLEAMEAARQAVMAAAGDAAALGQAMSDLEETFSQLTGQASRKTSGRKSSARTPIYLDCQRNFEAEIGTTFVQALGRPLSLLLTSTRWFTFELANRLQPDILDLYAQLAGERGEGVVEAAVFIPQLQSFLFGHPGQTIVNTLIQQFQAHWEEILPLPSEQRLVHFESDRLWSQVQTAFAAPCAGWQGARYHTLDLSIATASMAALQQGDYDIILNDLVLSNKLGFSFYLEQHPAPDEMIQAVAADLPQPRLIYEVPQAIVPPVRFSYNQFILAKDFRLALGNDWNTVTEAPLLSMSDLIVEREDGALKVCTRDKKVQFSLIEAIADTFTYMQFNPEGYFRVLPEQMYTPRISIDQLVITRETWHFPVADISFDTVKDEMDRFVAARRWANAHHLPRFLFIHTPKERKAFCIDLDSPIYVNIFARLVRRVRNAARSDGRITVTEMLPHPDDTWLPDNQGQRYSNKLRVITFDLVDPDQIRAA